MQGDFACCERLDHKGRPRIGRATLPRRFGSSRHPVDVEIFGEPAFLPVRQDIHPPRIIAADRHVVRNDVDDNPEFVTPELMYQPSQGFLAAEFGIDPRGIDNVVTVRRARAGRQDGRQIKVRDTERRKIGRLGRRVVEGEAAMKLQAHRGARQRHRSLRSTSGFNRSLHAGLLEEFRGSAAVAAAPVGLLVDRPGQIRLIFQCQRVFERQQRQMGSGAREKFDSGISNARALIREAVPRRSRLWRRGTLAKVLGGPWRARLALACQVGNETGFGRALQGRARATIRRRSAGRGSTSSLRRSWASFAAAQSLSAFVRTTARSCRRCLRPQAAREIRPVRCQGLRR